VIAVDPDVESVLISTDCLVERVRELGRQIADDYRGESLLLVGILRGAAVFLADLARAIDLPVDYDFVSISSYGDGVNSSRCVKVLGEIRTNVEGRHVLIVEDIVDTGWTLRMSSLAEDLLERGAASVKVCTLLDKPSRREVDVAIDYCGFVIEDRFVVGYGLDWAGRYRNLPYVGVLRPEIHSGKA
jgi:hypoxanthine phosphoribosyltransferase